MNHTTKLKHFLQENGADWMVWTRNTPAASHIGGVWKRQIKSARNILSSLLKIHGTSLNSEALTTLMTEVEAVLNSRSLTTELLSDDNSLNTIHPYNILTMKNKVVMPPPGEYGRADINGCKQWRRVQHITKFWNRWRKQFLVTLQHCQKWSKKKRDFQIGDIVLLKDDSHHLSHWPIACILEICVDKHGDVRNVKLKLGSQSNCGNALLERPISKIVLIMESHDTKQNIDFLTRRHYLSR